MDQKTHDALKAEIDTHAQALATSLQKLPEGPQRSIALSQIAEAKQLAEASLVMALAAFEQAELARQAAESGA